jgi:hypothetical protein
MIVGFEGSAATAAVAPIPNKMTKDHPFLRFHVRFMDEPPF